MHAKTGEPRRTDRRRWQLFFGRCSGEQILIMPTDRQRTSEPTLSEIYVSSKCETNSAFLPSQVSTTAPSLSRSPPPSPSSVFGVPMLIRRRPARALVLIRERREREEQIFLLLLLLLSSRFGTVPIYLSIFCAMHFSAKLTPSLSPSLCIHTSLSPPSFRCFYAHFPYIYLASLVDTLAFFMNPTSALLLLLSAAL